jgi:hypothetical protein
MVLAHSPLARTAVSDQSRPLPIVYSPIMTAKRRESTGWIRLFTERNLLFCNALTDITGLIRIGRPLIRWSRVRAPPAPLQPHFRVMPLIHRTEVSRTLGLFATLPSATESRRGHRF